MRPILDQFANPDNPLAHYQASGWREGRDPSPVFDTSAYLAANPDTAIDLDLSSRYLDPIEDGVDLALGHAVADERQARREFDEHLGGFVSRQDFTDPAVAAHNRVSLEVIDFPGHALLAEQSLDLVAVQEELAPAIRVVGTDTGRELVWRDVDPLDARHRRHLRRT